MPVRDFEIGADIDLLEDLNEQQRLYLARFQAIHAEIEGTVTDLTNNWEGQASGLFTESGNSIQADLGASMASFIALLAATQRTIENYGNFQRKLNGIFG